MNIEEEFESLPPFLKWYNSYCPSGPAHELKVAFLAGAEAQKQKDVEIAAKCEDEFDIGTEARSGVYWVRTAIEKG